MADGFCGTCKWHQYDEYGRDWVCANGGSEYAANYTGYNDCCEEFEKGKNNEQKKENPTPGGKLFNVHKLHSHRRGRPYLQ